MWFPLRDKFLNIQCKRQNSILPITCTYQFFNSICKSMKVKKEFRRHNEKLLLTYDHSIASQGRDTSPHPLVTNAASSSNSPTIVTSLFRSWKLFICSRYQVEPCGSSARYQGSHEWRRVRQDRWRGRAFRGGLVSVTFSTPPEKAANGVHVLDYVIRIAGTGARVKSFSDPVSLLVPWS